MTVDSGSNLTIDDLNFTQGNAGTGNGGGISIAGGFVSIDSCVISDSTATNGGGIALTGGRRS